jgi:hypothetical protein
MEKYNFRLGIFAVFSESVVEFFYADGNFFFRPTSIFQVFNNNDYNISRSRSSLFNSSIV